MANLPAGQSVHDVWPAVTVTVNWPSAQSLQTDVVLVGLTAYCESIVLHCPTTPMYWPAGQLEHADRS